MPPRSASIKSSSGWPSAGKSIHCAAAALPAIVSERVLQPRAPRVDRQVAGFQEQLDGVEPVQDQVLRPPGEDSRAEHPLVLGVGGRAQRRSSRCRRVDADQVDAAVTRESIGQRLDGMGIFLAHHVEGVVIGEHGDAGPVGVRIGADLEEHRRGVPRRAGVDGAADGVSGVVLGRDGDVAGRVEAGEPDALGRLEELGIDLLPAQPGILIQADDLIEELARQVGLVGVGGIGRLDGGRLGEDAPEDRERGAALS